MSFNWYHRLGLDPWQMSACETHGAELVALGFWRGVSPPRVTGPTAQRRFGRAGLRADTPDGPAQRLRPQHRWAVHLAEPRPTPGVARFDKAPRPTPGVARSDKAPTAAASTPSAAEL